VYSKRQKLELPGGREKEMVLQEVDMSPGVLLVDVIRNFPYLPEGNTRPIRTNILVYADTKGQLGTRIEWEDKKAAANERIARQQAGAGAVAPPAGATPPTLRPTPTPRPPTPRPPKGK
jgi:hypothetical protein